MQKLHICTVDDLLLGYSKWSSYFFVVNGAQVPSLEKNEANHGLEGEEG